MRWKVVATHWIHKEVADFLETFAHVSRPIEPGTVWSHEKMLQGAADADALITCMADFIDAKLLGACPRLKIIAATLKGYDSYDADACAQRGVYLCNVPDSIIPPTAELAITLTLSLLRNIRLGDSGVRSGCFTGWRPQLYSTSLLGASVGIVGMGQLGQATARLADGFGIAQLLYMDTNDTSRPGEIRCPQRRVDLLTLFKECAVIILTLPLLDSTYRLIGKSCLSTCTAGTYLINVGRGSVVDEDAVVSALQTGQLAGYAADVFAFEDWTYPGHPSSISEELRTHPRTLFTPHLGSAVDHVRKEMSMTSAKQIYELYNGRTPRYTVNKLP